MNTIATLAAPVFPTEQPRVRPQYPRTILPAWKSPQIRPVNPWTNRFLRSLPDTCLERIERSLRTVTLPAAEYLCEQEAIPEYVYFPETAVISHQKMLADGRTVEIALTGRNDSLGMASVFGSGISYSSAQVAQAGIAARIEREVLIKIVRVYPELIPLLAADIGHYINDISRHSICNTYHDVRQRLSTWLLVIGDLSGKVRLALTHEQIASALGVYRPTVTCTMVQMRLDDLIGYSRGMVIIEDRPGLQQAACSCYAELAAG